MPELSHGVNPRLPSASVGLEIQWSEERGRAFIATRDLSPGNVLLMMIVEIFLQMTLQEM